MAIADPTDPITTPTIKTTAFVPMSADVLSWNSLCKGYHVCNAVTANTATIAPNRP